MGLLQYYQKDQHSNILVTVLGSCLTLANTLLYNTLIAKEKWYDGIKSKKIRPRWEFLGL